MSEYLKFMEKYFPYSSKIPNEDKIYQLVCENNLMVGIILSNMDASRFYLNEEKLIFYRRYRDGVNKILIYIPLNDEIGIYACMRYSIEQLLKFIYSIYPFLARRLRPLRWEMNCVCYLLDIAF